MPDSSSPARIAAIVAGLKCRADHCRQQIRQLRFHAARLELDAAENSQVGLLIRQIEEKIAHWQTQYDMAKSGINRRSAH